MYLVGRVMMDCAVVDVTRLPGVGLGDEVTLIGKSGRNEITAAEVAALAGSSPYEVLCSLGRRVRRIYTRDGKRVLLPERGAAPAPEGPPVLRPAGRRTP